MSLQRSLPVHCRWFHLLPAGLLIALLALPGIAQYIPSKSQFPSQQSTPQKTQSIDDFGVNEPAMNARRLQALNESRHKSIVKDTQKLLDLATELNTEIQSTSPDSLTPAQIRLLAEIAKLAHHVETKMRAIVQPNPPSPPLAPANR